MPNTHDGFSEPEQQVHCDIEPDPPHRIFVFYSNASPETAAFLQKLSDVEKINPHYTFILTMTNMGTSSSPWTGTTGYITADMVKQYVPDLASPIYYICRPKGMAAAMRQMVCDAGVDEDTIRTEEFSGY